VKGAPEGTVYSYTIDDPDGKIITVRAEFPNTRTAISLFKGADLTAARAIPNSASSFHPVTGNTIQWDGGGSPAKPLLSGAYYTGLIKSGSWSNGGSISKPGAGAPAEKFASGIAYTAVITLTPTDGYTFAGLTDTSFFKSLVGQLKSGAGAMSSISNATPSTNDDAGTVDVTVVFNATASEPLTGLRLPADGFDGTAGKATSVPTLGGLALTAKTTVTTNNVSGATK